MADFGSVPGVLCVLHSEAVCPPLAAPLSGGRFILFLSTPCISQYLRTIRPSENSVLQINHRPSLFGRQRATVTNFCFIGISLRPSSDKFVQCWVWTLCWDGATVSWFLFCLSRNCTEASGLNSFRLPESCGELGDWLLYEHVGLAGLLFSQPDGPVDPHTCFPLYSTPRFYGGPTP